MDIEKSWSELVVDGRVPREAILAIEDAMTQGSIASVEVDDHNISCPVSHHFAPGVYAREFPMPKGYVVVGKIHKHAHFSVITKGDVSVLTEFGIERIKAPHMFVSQPGSKRVVYAHEDSVWTTFHPTDETDLDAIENQVIAKSFEEFDQSVLASADKQEVLI